LFYAKQLIYSHYIRAFWKRGVPWIWITFESGFNFVSAQPG
jgi:hypothetical protein